MKLYNILQELTEKYRTGKNITLEIAKMEYLLKVAKISKLSKIDNEGKHLLNTETINEFRNIVINKYQITLDDYYNSRKRRVISIRNLIFYYLYQINAIKLKDIALIARKNHSTILHALNVTQNLLDVDKETQRNYIIIREIGNSYFYGE